jgi:hypothetical protein
MRIQYQTTGKQHCLRAVGRAKLAQDGSHVRLNGGLGNLQLIGDVFVEPSQAQHSEYPKLLRGKLRQALGKIERCDIGVRFDVRPEADGRYILAAQHRLNVAADRAGIGGSARAWRTVRTSSVAETTITGNSGCEPRKCARAQKP